MVGRLGRAHDARHQAAVPQAARSNLLTGVSGRRPFGLPPEGGTWKPQNPGCAERSSRLPASSGGRGAELSPGPFPPSPVSAAAPPLPLFKTPVGKRKKGGVVG